MRRISLRGTLVFGLLLAGLSSAPLVAHANSFKSGIQAFEDQDWDKVLKKLTPYLKEPNLLPDYVLFMVGTAELHEDKCSDAVTRFQELRKSYPQSIYATESILAEAQALLCAKQFETARARAQQFLKTKPFKREQQMTELLIAESYLEEGNKAVAKQKLGDFWVDARDDDLAEKALALHKKAGGHIGSSLKWRRARHLHKMREWVQTKKLLVELGAQDSFLFAECIYRLHDYPRAIKLYESLISRGVNVNRARSRIATMSVRLGNIDKAIKQNIAIAKKSAGSQQRRALKEVASLHRDRHDFKKAAKVLEDLLAKPLRRKEKIDAMEDYAWVNYRAGNYEVALATIEDLLAMKLKREQGAKYLYWKGQFLSKQIEQEKDKELKKEMKKEMKQAFREAWNENKWDYYGIASLRALNEDDDKFFADLRTQDQKRARRIRTVSVDPDPPTDGMYHLPRAEALHDMGFNRLATKEMKQAYYEAKRSPALMKRVGEIAYTVQNYYVPMVVAMRKPGLLDRPEDAWHWIYPAAYPSIVQRHAGRRQLDENLVYSMMRQESAFQESVVSSAGARGLIQIMPFTGKRLARIMGWKGFKTMDLFEPEINITLSTLYIRMNADRFDGHLPAVIASYNAGEYAVDRWMPSRKNLEYWEFMEEIPYRETNKYTKKVMRNYWMYQYLEGKSPTSSKTSKKKSKKKNI